MVAAPAAKRFPLGVADPGAARAFVHNRAGTVLALDLATGQVRWRAGTALPDWAQASLDDTPDYTLRAEAEGGTVVLRWAAQARYRGGAPPSAMVQAAAERQAQGAARVDVGSGAVESLPEPAVAPTHADAPAAPASDPDVLEQADIGGTRFQLVVRDDAEERVRTLVRAVDRGTGRTVWETVIDEAPRPRPRPPRP